MKLADLHNFVVVAETKNFARAAERLHRTQPSIVASIKRLERDVGQALVVRVSGGGLVLTIGGHVLIEHATRLLAIRDDVRSAIARLPVARP